MNSFSVLIKSIQHIRSFRFDVDLADPKLICLVGRNGVGKTTLFRAIRNLSVADTFVKTANPQIFGDESRIEYAVGEYEVAFEYDPSLRSLNCRELIPANVRNAVVAELPIPHGARFHYFRSAGDADDDIRQAVVLRNYKRPSELIEFLATIYASNKYESLVEISVKRKVYYCIILPDGRYIREDYLSSGEYFLINLYRTIKGKARLIAVDEIDLSLDAAAQAKIVAWLRTFCREYGCTILFTTHSLATMRTLEDSELRFLEQEDGEVTHYPVSYNYVKARLFGFVGWDKYILTEDAALVNFINYVVQRYCPGAFFQVRVVPIGGATHVSYLVRRNEREQFLSAAANVMAILDGDQRNEQHAQHASIYFIPMESVEKAVLAHYDDGDFPYRLPMGRPNDGKILFKQIQEQQIASREEIFGYLCLKYEIQIRAFVQVLEAFLGRRRP